MANRYAPAAYIDLFRFTTEKLLDEFGINEELDEEYIFTGIYDLSEEWIRKDLMAMGESYD